MEVEVFAVACTLLLGIVMAQMAAMFRSAAGRRWSVAFVILAVAQLLRPIQWEVHVAAEIVFVMVLWSGCRNIVRTRFWKSKSTMYGLLITLLVALDVVDVFAHEGLTSHWNLGFGDLTFSILVGCSLIMLMAETAQWKLEKSLSDVDGARQMLEERLHTDVLTQAFSRHAFHWIQQGSEITTEGALSGVVVMFDVDGLKHINDTYGHHAGDSTIRAVANAIRAVIRADDLLFRWGGDEFVAILPNLSAAQVTTRLREFDEPFGVLLDDGSIIDCRITSGVAEFGAGYRLDEAIRFADVKMYETRQARRTA